MKKIILSLIFPIILLLSSVSADKIEIYPTKEIFLPREKITFKVSVYDDLNMPIDSDVKILIEDAEKTRIIEQNIKSNKFVDIALGENAPSGYWKIIAFYKNIESSSIFMIETAELAKFELVGDILTITNVGNTRYTKTIQIVIGESIGTKQIDLGVGEKISFRLVAPSGTYNIKITDGKNTLVQPNVALTGKVIGILDETPLSQSPITTSMDNKDNLYSDNPPILRNKTFAYIFIIMVIAGAILIAIERHYRRRAHLAGY
ncbi:MAG: hypothetical protein N3D20_00485 [Candidatus Pacearchaeota archaeon]|nr:hypothetical protein [Candidatus Pacearchaeota archaeon]